MGKARFSRVDGAVFADCLFLVGQAWVRRAAGDAPGADEDLAAPAARCPELFSEEFDKRLSQLSADAEALKAAGELGPPPPMPPERPPWEDDSAVTGLSRPGSLSESLRKMGLM